MPNIEIVPQNPQVMETIKVWLRDNPEPLAWRFRFSYGGYSHAVEVVGDALRFTEYPDFVKLLGELFELNSLKLAVWEFRQLPELPVLDKRRFETEIDRALYRLETGKCVKYCK